MNITDLNANGLRASVERLGKTVEEHLTATEKLETAIKNAVERSEEAEKEAKNSEDSMKKSKRKVRKTSKALHETYLTGETEIRQELTEELKKVTAEYGAAMEENHKAMDEMHKAEDERWEAKKELLRRKYKRERIGDRIWTTGSVIVCIGLVFFLNKGSDPLKQIVSYSTLMVGFWTYCVGMVMNKYDSFKQDFNKMRKNIWDETAIFCHWMMWIGVLLFYPLLIVKCAIGLTFLLRLALSLSATAIVVGFAADIWSRLFSKKKKSPTE